MTRKILGLGLFFCGLLACAGSAVVMAQPDTGAMDEDPLSELAAMADFLAEDGPDAGGSIRAKKKPDSTRTNRIRDKRNIQAKVVKVKLGQFPRVALKLKVLKDAKKGRGGRKAFRRNSRLVVTPNLDYKPTTADGRLKVDFKAPMTVRNAGAYYLTPGDKVVLRLGKKVGNYWTVDYIERK